MRWSLAALAMVAACTTEMPTNLEPTGGPGSPWLEEGRLDWESTFAVEFQGIFLPSGRGYGIAGMAGNTCLVSYGNGAVGSDLDVHIGRDVVDDGISEPDRDEVLVTEGAELRHVAFPSGDLFEERTVPGLITARFVADGMVYLARDGECRVGFTATDLSVVVDARACDNGVLEVDDVSGTVFVAGGQPMVVTPQGALAFGIGTESATFGTFSDASGLLYTASGVGDVRAYDTVGGVVWSAAVEGQVRGFDELGEIGMVIAAVARDGSDALVLLDAETGAVIDEQDMDRAANPVVASPDGLGIALLHRDQTDFFTAYDAQDSW